MLAVSNRGSYGLDLGCSNLRGCLGLCPIRVESRTFVTFDCVLSFRWIQAVSDRGACGGGVGGLVELPGTSFRVESWSASSIECYVVFVVKC